MSRTATASASLRDLLSHPLAGYFYAPSLLFSIARAAMLLVLPLYADTFDVSYGVIGLVLACMALGTMLGDIPAGMLLRRWPIKAVMVGGLSLFALAMIVQIFAPSIFLVGVCQLVAGMGQALFGVAQHTIATTEIPIERRGRALSILGGVFRIGGFLGPALGGVVADQYGLRIAFWPVAFIALAACVLVIRFLPTADEDGAFASEHSRPRVVVEHPTAHLLTILRTHWRVLLAGGVGFMLAMIVRQGRSAILPLYGADEIGLDVAHIGLIMSLTSAVDMALFPTAGIIMDRWGRKWAIVPSFIIQASGMLLISVAGSFLGLLAAGMLIGLGNSISSGTMMTVGADLAPDNARGEFLGVWRLIGDLGAASGPLAVGGIADAIALPSAAVALAGAGVLAAGVFGHFVPETLRRHQTA